MMESVVPFLQHAYWIELFQLVAALIGTFANVWGVLDSWKDLKFVVQNRVNGRRLFAAKRNLFEESIRLVIHGLFLINGIVSILYAPPAPGMTIPDDRYVQLMVARAVMTIASVLLTIKSVRDIQDRQRLRHMFDHEHVTPVVLDVIKNKAEDIVQVIQETRDSRS